MPHDTESSSPWVPAGARVTRSVPELKASAGAVRKLAARGTTVLLSIAAVVLGGTLLAGGKGSVIGTIGGVAIFAVIDNVMGVMQVNPFLKDFVRGLVIVLAVAVYARRSVVSRPPRFGPDRVLPLPGPLAGPASPTDKEPA